jgi:hypothetical protein
MAPMNTRDPMLIALQFNECINKHDVDGLAELMTDDHTFIDREGRRGESRGVMTQGWREFFAMFPHYRNTFTRIQSTEDRVAILGSAYWSDRDPSDRVIWTAVISNDLVREWRVYEDTETNRERFGLV